MKYSSLYGIQPLKMLYHRVLGKIKGTVLIYRGARIRMEKGSMISSKSTLHINRARNYRSRWFSEILMRKGATIIAEGVLFFILLKE